MEIIIALAFIAAMGVAGYRLYTSSKDMKKAVQEDFPLEKLEEEDTEAELKRYLNNFNYLRGKELYDRNEFQDAFEYLKKAIDDEPNNGYAHGMIGDMFYQTNDYGTALKAYDNAIRVMPPAHSAIFYVGRARVYRSMDRKKEWLADCNKAIEIDPEFAPGYDERAGYHYTIDDHEGTLRDIEKFISLDPHNPYGYMVKGRSLFALNRAEEALDEYKYAESLDSSYAAAFSFQAEALLVLGRESEAITAIIRATELEDENQPDRKGHEMRSIIAKQVGRPFFLRLMAKINEGNDVEKWMLLLGVCLSVADKKAEAACWYERVYQIDDDPVHLSYAAFCWREAGNVERSIALHRKAIERISDMKESQMTFACALVDAGLYEEALSVYTHQIRKSPDDATCYQRRARVFELMGRKEEAIDDYSTSYSLSGSFDPLYHSGKLRAEINPSCDNEDLKKIIKSSDCTEKIYFEANALYLVGKVDEADSCIKKCETYLGKSHEKKEEIKLSREVIEYYCLTGDVNRAIFFTEQLLKKNYRYFHSLLHDPELKVLRESAKYLELVEQYQIAAIKEWERAMQDILTEEPEPITNTESAPLMSTSIPFTRENGICKVPCTVNRLPLHFVFDTGASDVSISSVEANFMLKNGFLTQNDLGGLEYYRNASGEISEGTKVCIREVDFGGLKLKNIKASVVKNQQAPLLLGQSVLQRLGKIEIDNANNMLKVTNRS